MAELSSVPTQDRITSAGKTELRDLTVIVPTRNEAGNVDQLYRELSAAMEGNWFKVLFVDDSEDETPEVVGALSRATGGQVSLLHRPAGQRDGGLGGAVLAGIRQADTTWVCVMDADLQHPPSVVPQLLEKALATEADVVVASRYVPEGDSGEFATSRRLVSRGSTLAAQVLFPGKLRGVTDPMSGFFLLRREAINPDVLRPKGFKILLEILVRSHALRCAEVPFTFGTRHSGESKASLKEGATYARNLARLRVADTKDRLPLANRTKTVYRYNVHGLITVESEGELPELAAFRVSRLERIPDITVHIGRPPKGRKSSVPAVDFAERTKWAGFATRIEKGERTEVWASQLVKRSPHVLYTNIVEPILRWAFVERGFALVHGACLSQGDRAYLVTARTDTGKTTTMLKILDRFDCGFLSDDLTLVHPDGTVLPYPKPLTISRHTLHAVRMPLLNRKERAGLFIQSRLHSRSGRKFAFLLTKTRMPVATVNTIVQLLVPPPKYAVQRLVPGVDVRQKAKLAGMFIIQRGGTGEETLPNQEALDILLENCEDAYGFPPYEQIEGFLHSNQGSDLRSRERSIINDAFSGCPAVLLRSETMDWAERIPAFIARDVPAEQAEAQAEPSLAGRV